ncbi:MAG: SDR family oxidoreductase, partial [Sphingobacteriaceae bacterium]|nr:SDR family oxidoreductase [Cytophagaceae bacterium]
MKNFNGKTVWITGASSGIGEALAYEFAREGAQLVLSARREDELQRVKRGTALPDANVLVLPLDMTAVEPLSAAVETVLRKFGAVDVLVQNAGISQRSLVHETSLDVHRQLMEVNYFGVVALTNAVLPAMRNRKSGHFIVISSVTGYVATPLRAAYAASKHAIRAFFDALRAENHGLGLRVTVACPGYIWTDVSKNALQGDGAKHGKMDQNQEKGMTPEACARHIVRAAKAEKLEVYPGGIEIFGIYLNRWLPGLVARAVRNWNEV